MKSVNKLYQLLRDVHQKCNSNCLGLGVLMYTNLEHLPIYPLKQIDEHINLPISNYDRVIDTLVSISKSNSKYHDGFHLINENLELTHLSQYIAPPIVNEIDLSNEHGSRYATALLVSFIPNVICSGVFSLNYPVTIFKHGEIVTNTIENCS